MRVQIPAYTDRWMMGDRFGEIVSQTVKKVEGLRVHVARVKLDISGKIIRVRLDDCTEV